MFVYGNRDVFADRAVKHEYDTRHTPNLVPEKYNYTYLQKMQNYFSKEIKNLPKNKLKSALKKYLSIKAFYVSEFFSDPHKNIYIGQSPSVL